MSIPLSVAFLASSSSGNSAVLRCGKTTLLLDAGLSVRETGRRLEAVGASLDQVAAVFLTHEHSDHVRSAADLALRKGIPVWATPGTITAARFPGPLFADIRPLPERGEVQVGEILVRAIPTPHDGAESVCYLFIDGSGRRIGVVTDLGHLSNTVLEALSGCEVLGVEANHDVDLLRTGPYPAFLKRRILSDVGHLSNEAAASGLLRLVGARTLSVTALHLSQKNNTPELVRRALGATLAETGAHLSLEVAGPDRPTGWRAAARSPNQEESL
jgi:phosphoribosyl 1,2-cyclic phosphodiesterase